MLLHTHNMNLIRIVTQSDLCYEFQKTRKLTNSSSEAFQLHCAILFQSNTFHIPASVSIMCNLVTCQQVGVFGWELYPSVSIERILGKQLYFLEDS